MTSEALFLEDGKHALREHLFRIGVLTDRFFLGLNPVCRGHKQQEDQANLCQVVGHRETNQMKTDALNDCQYNQDPLLRLNTER
jgi:hypothetical protein